MYVTTPKRKNGSTAVRLVHGFRKDGKVKIKIIKTLGQSKDPEAIAHLKQAAFRLKAELQTGVRPSPLEPPENIPLSSLRGQRAVNDGVQDILGSIYKRLGFDNLISGSRKDPLWNRILKYCVFIRFLEPASKLRSVQLIQDRFQELFSHDQVLRMMDHLSKKEKAIKGHLLKTVMEKSQSLELLLFDVTTLYFENITETDLKAFGFSKDGKFKEVQVVLALLTDSQGLPLTYEVFAGNTAETKTLIHCFKQLRGKYNLRKFRLTADRALFSSENLSYFESREVEKEGLSEYIVACPLKKLPVLQKRKVLDKSHYIWVNESFCFFEFFYQKRRFVACYSKKAAQRDQRQREKLLEKARKMADKEGKIPIERLSRNKGVNRYLEKRKGFVRIKREAVSEEERWDGIFGVCTNIKGIGGQELFSSYKRLWKIEESFRINKHTLRMRPIYHQLSRRIKAHVLICFLTYTAFRYGELFLRERGLYYSPGELIDILSGIEKWVTKDLRTGRQYVIPKKLSKEERRIYKVFGIERKNSPYRILGTSGSRH